jgi:F0F1-type ATP synthase epsilon subunit
LLDPDVVLRADLGRGRVLTPVRGAAQVAGRALMFSRFVQSPIERVLVNGTASQVILRTADGDITFLAGHTPLVGAVEPGVVRVVGAEGDEERIAVHGGFVQVEQHVAHEATGEVSAPVAPVGSSSSLGGTRVTVLTGVAELATEIDAERAQAALAASEAKVAELTAAGGRGSGAGSAAGSGEGENTDADAELADAEASLRRAQVRLEATGVAVGTSA